MPIAPIAPRTLREYEAKGPKCQVVGKRIADLSAYFSLLNSLLTTAEPFWFRGHSSLDYKLTPSALRHATLNHRKVALGLIDDFRRLAEIKLPHVSAVNSELKWLQLAQHYGLGTRLLDWTENVAAALYFACSRPEENGAVYMLNPVELNRQVDSKRPRVFDAERDADVIAPYLKLSGLPKLRGSRTIAIHPVLNSDRIVLQKGVFTLHGSRKFGLDGEQAPSLVKIPILARDKPQLLLELDRVGINQSTLFPELEHLCKHLTRKAGLE